MELMAHTQSFTYDGLNRLTSAARSDGGYNHTYSYDSFGNLLIQDNINPGPSYSINPATNQLNRYANGNNAYTYDAAGNLISSGTSDIGGHTFAYNSSNQIVSVDGGATATYLYNGLDERMEKDTPSGWTDYIYLNGQPMAELTSASLWTDYIYANGQKIARIADPYGAPTTVSYYLNDHLGTAQVELDASGNVTWQGQFTPFGAELPDGSTAMHYKFTGKERDTESGLDYFGARYYTSNMGRFMSPDWSSSPSGVPYANLSDPQSLNLYGYMGNNPLGGVDADGHCCQWLSNFGTGLANSTYRPLVQAVEHPITTLKGLGTAIEHPIATAEGAWGGIKSTSVSVMQGDGTAIGTAVGSAAMLFVPGGEEAEAGEGLSRLSLLSDDANVVRGGLPGNIANGTGVSVGADGTLSGVSVQSANGASVADLSTGIPHNQVSVTTVGDVRAAGGDVVPSPNAGNPNHCTMCGVTPQQAKDIMKTIPNPSKKP